MGMGSNATTPPPVHGDYLQTSSQKIQDFLYRLEQERVKIDAFKRELPLCMQLLNNAMEAYKEQLEPYHGEERNVLLEEFIPIKKNDDEDGIQKLSYNSNNAAGTGTGTSNMEKSSWMTSVQLWTNDSTTSEAAVTPKPALESNGAFLPFYKVERSSSSTSNKGNLPDLSLSSLDTVKDDVVQIEGKSNTRSEVQVPSPATTQGGTGSHRKPRRCWSPDLHERFVNALNMLGGPQLATPKQIRELMKVDGLTNDEVKSHLQKYRLHTRRPNPLLQPTPPGAPQLVVLGGIWVPPEYAAAAGATFYGAHPSAATAHYCATTSANQHFPLHHLHHSRQTFINRSSVMGYNGRGIYGASESDANLSERSMKTGGEEENDDNNDEKAVDAVKTVGKEREEKNLVSVGDASNGSSEVTLKF